MTDNPDPASAAAREAKPHRWRFALGAVAILAAMAAGAGADALAHRRPAATYVALAPQPVSGLKDDTMAAVKGRVVEIFGNKFIVEDTGGRVLVETGKRGEDGRLVAMGEEVTAQGRFVHGFIHAVAITHADGRIDRLDPPPPPPPPRA